MLLGVCLLLAFKPLVQRIAAPVIQRIKGKKTVQERINEYGEPVRSRLEPLFQKVNVDYPPEALLFLAVKDDNKLYVYARSKEWEEFRLVKTYPVLKASGVLGPKLREGDYQVPEGIYNIESLNPNSLFHLSLRLNYPNAFDKEKAKLDGRNHPGSDIMIHGSNVSIGCLAMGDEAAEELFILASKTGLKNIKVIIAPVDFRKKELPEDMPEVPDWTEELYSMIRTELNKLPDK